MRAVRGRSTKTYSVLLSERTGAGINAPGKFCAVRGAAFSLLWRIGWGLPLLCWRALSSTGVRRGGELRAWLRRSSVSRSFASSAWSSSVWVETACFLGGELSAGAMRRRGAGHALLMHRLVEQVDAAVEPEEVVEL